MNIYNIPARFNFTKTLVDKLSELSNGNLNEISQYLILLPSRRACRNLREALISKNNYKPLMLPKMYPIGEVDEEELDFDNFASSEFFEIEDAISSLEQRITLTNIIKQYYPDKLLSEAIGLAVELQSFLAGMQKEKINFDQLEKLYPADLATHWQKIVSFLEIVSDNWPKILKERNLIDPIERRNRVLEERARLWSEKPPPYKVIAAGSTGSLPSTAILLKAIANMPNGKVILPGLDPFIDDVSWKNIDEFHPQFLMKKLLKFIDYNHKEVKDFLPKMENEASSLDRSIFLSEIMRPAATSHQWLNFKQLKIGTLKNFSLINLNNMQQEANVISVIIREILEDQNKTIALITADNDLAKRVSQLVKRWNIDIDYSAGQKLSDTVIGIYLRLIINLIKSNFSAIDLLALLKHPLCNLGLEKTRLENLINELELSSLRGIKKNTGLIEIRNSVELTNNDELLKLIDHLIDLSKNIKDIYSNKFIKFNDILEAHIVLAQKIHSAEDKDMLWNSHQGEEFLKFIEELKLYSQQLGIIDPNNYIQIFDNLIIGKTYRKPYNTNPRAAILTPIEARMNNFDVIILGGLNEGVWPKYPESGPWMSRSMQIDMGLAQPEKKIGQAALDFYTLAHAKEVILTRSIKIDGTLTVPSRWLQRLETVLKAVGFKENNFNIKPWVKWVELLTTPSEFITIKSPEPKPAICFRPTVFSVTQIEKFMRDPYSIYASQILKLKAIDDIDYEPQAKDFGNFIHKTLEYYINNQTPDSDDLELLKESAKLALKDLTNNHIISTLWWPRFERISNWMIEKNYLISQNNIYSEVKGKIDIIVDGIKYTLNTKADRVEIDAKNQVSIIDYKTGQLPTSKNIQKGISSQMILEALIAIKNGYFCQARNIRYQVGELNYIRLTGSANIGEVKKIEDDLENLIKQATNGLEELFRLFNNKDVPYLYCPNPAIEPRYNEYKHLARQQEWIE